MIWKLPESISMRHAVLWRLLRMLRVSFNLACLKRPNISMSTYVWASCCHFNQPLTQQEVQWLPSFLELLFQQLGEQPQPELAQPMRHSVRLWRVEMATSLLRVKNSSSCHCQFWFKLFKRCFNKRSKIKSTSTQNNTKSSWPKEWPGWHLRVHGFTSILSNWLLPAMKNFWRSNLGVSASSPLALCAFQGGASDLIQLGNPNNSNGWSTSSWFPNVSHM